MEKGGGVPVLSPSNAIKIPRAFMVVRLLLQRFLSHLAAAQLQNRPRTGQQHRPGANCYRRPLEAARRCLTCVMQRTPAMFPTVHCRSSPETKLNISGGTDVVFVLESCALELQTFSPRDKLMFLVGQLELKTATFFQVR